MAPGTSSSISTVLTTSLALIDQFISSLNVTSTSPTPAEPTSHPSPLHLLSASATSLKSSTTKLSLLTITAPFTPSAIISVLQPLNSSILPSLVTATLLTTPTLYPQSFVKECHTLTLSTLRDLKLLLHQIKLRSEDNRPKSPLSEPQKKPITEATGKIWENCDLLVRFSTEGIPGFVVRKANQWLDLMKDAVKELEEWDPEEEEDPDDEDWFGGDLSSSSPSSPTTSPKDPASTSIDMNTDSDRATISTGVKDQALKVLSRIPQSIHVVIKQRLEKVPTTSTSPSSSSQPMTPLPLKQRQTLDAVLKRTRTISECIDESAEAMYMGDLELCLRKAGEARMWTIEVVEAVVEPWADRSGDGKETKEDQYIRRALLWIQQVQTQGSAGSVNGEGKSKSKGKEKEEGQV